MRSRRNVTLHPIGIPSRILNAATDLRAIVVTGRWPEIFSISSRAFSSTFLSATASPTPIFSVILVMRGTSIGFCRPSFFWISPMSSVLYFSCKRDMSFVSAVARRFIPRGEAGTYKILRLPIKCRPRLRS